MTNANPTSDRSRWLRIALATALVAMLAVGAYLVWPSRTGNKVVAYFTSAVGLYPGDDVRIVGVPVGTIDSIEPRAGDVKVTMTLHDDVKVANDAKALIISPNLVSSRFVQLAPAYTGGPALADGADIGLDRTAVPVEWDEVKEQLTALSRELGPQQGSMQGPLSNFVNQAADTFDGNGDSFRQALRELSQTAGRLGDSRTDLFGTVKNLQVLVNALSNSNEQIVQFTNHVASVSQVLADSSADLDNTLGTLNQALGDVRGFLNDSNDALINQVNKLTDFTSILTEHSDDIEQILHITPNGLANFYNIYNPAQGTVGGLLTLPNFANPVQFICGGVFDAGTSTDNYKRAEICRQRMGPVLRRITMNFPPLMLHPINSITAYKGQIIYDTPETEAKAQTPVPYLQWQPRRRQPAETLGRNRSQFVDGAAHAIDVACGRPRGRACAGSGRPDLARAGRPQCACRGASDRRRWLMSNLLRDKASRAAVRTVAISAGAALLAGCSFGGLNSLDMPGTAGHGSGAYKIVVQLPDVSTLPQNSPVMVDDVTVGSVSGINAVQRADGSFYAAVAVVVGRERQTAGERDRQGCADLTAGIAARRAFPAGRRQGCRSAQERLTDPTRPHRPVPDHRGSAVVSRRRGEQGQSRCAAGHHR